MTLTFGTHKASCTQLVDIIYQLCYQAILVSEKSIVLPVSYTKAKGTKFDLAVK